MPYNNTLVIIIGIVTIIMGFPVTIVAVMDLAKKWRNWRKPVSDSAINATKLKNLNIKLISLRQPESGRKSWVINEILAIILSILLLVLDGYVIYSMVTKPIAFTIDLASIFFLTIYTGLPLFVISSKVISMLSYWKTGISLKRAQGEIVLKGETEAILNECHRSLVDMGVKITVLSRKPNHIMGELEKDKMSVTVRCRRGKNHTVSILSQCKRPTDMFDSGRNSNNVNLLIERIIFIRGS